MQFARIDGVISERSGERVVVLDGEGAALITLSPVGAIVWELLPCDAERAVEALGEQFPDVPRAVLRDDVRAFLDELVANSLIIEIDAAG